MKRITLSLLSALALLAGNTVAHAQGVYAGLGLPGLYNVGYSHALSKSFGLRAQYSGGLDYDYTGDAEGVNVNANLKSTSVGVFADWYPFEGGFRVVGGLARNNIKAALKATGGSGTVNGKSVTLTGEYYNMDAKFKETTPYLGIGYGHHMENKGLGFYFDFGFLIGRFDVTSETSLVTSGQVTQADIDAQNAKVRDSVSGLRALPVLHLGMAYRF
jgi:hypothetical protein